MTEDGDQDDIVGFQDGLAIKNSLPKIGREFESV
jgi:hypothetical protein